MKKRSIPASRNWLISLLLLGQFAFYGKLFAQDQQTELTQYVYRIETLPGTATKDNLGSITEDLGVTDQYVLPDGFEFRLSFPVNIAQRMQQLGISYINIEVEKRSARVLEEEKAGGNNCELAQQLCSNASVSGNSSGPGIQELNGVNHGCLVNNEHQSSWYYIYIQTGGNLTMLIDPSVNSTDYDFAIWGPHTAATANANCPPILGPARCSYYDNSNGSGNTGLSGTVLAQGVSEGTTGDGFVGELTTLAGQVYILLVDNFNSSGTSYSLSFGGSAVLGCTPIVLPVELSEFKGAAFNRQNILQWTTESEYGSKDFTLEWTSDPFSESWQNIGSVEAKIFSDVQNHYSFVHSSPDPRKINYYRLVQRDQEGYEHVYTNKMIAIDNSDTRKIVRIVDLMGRDADEFGSGIVIYLYDDGTTEKGLR